jgi:hypothetical protein
MKTLKVFSVLGGFMALIVLTTPLFNPIDGCAKEIGGNIFPDEVMVGEIPCRLVGIGLRKKFFVDVYYGAFYMQQPTRDPAQAIASDQAKRIVLQVVYKEVEAAKWVEGWQEGFAANTPNADPALKARMNQFLGCFKEPVKKGEAVQITYVPGSGTEVVIKGKTQGTIPGDDFMKALLSIWFGKHPASQDLMKGMLGI